MGDRAATGLKWGLDVGPLVGAILIVGLGGLGGLALRLEGGTTLDVPLMVTEVPVNNTPSRSWPVGQTRVDWFQASRIVRVDPDGRRTILTSRFGAAGDPSVSFDGSHFLFSARRVGETLWRIWEADLDGEGARAITPEDLDCRSPLYVSSLFTLDSPQPWYTMLFSARERTFDEGGSGLAFSLFSVRLDGKELRRVTANPSHDFDPFQLGDSRVIYAGRRFPRVADGAAGRVSLFGINIDGTDLEFFGGARGRRIQWMPCATEEGDIVFVESDEATPDGAGQLAALREQRPHHSYRRLTDDPEHGYLYPSPLAGGGILVSRRPGDGSTPCAVYRYSLDSGKLAPVYAEAGYHCVQAKAVGKRPEPDGRSTIVNTKFNSGLLYALNCYDTDETMREHLRPGEVKRLRVIEGVPESLEGASLSGNRPTFRRRLLGVVPVAADGSCNIEVPADIPVELQTLDKDGLALATCGWIWVKQRERRGCIGCHEDPELTPENTFVQSVQRPSIRLTLPPASRRSVGFREHVFPILQRSCATADCHGGSDTPPYIPGEETAGIENAARKLFDTLVGVEPGARRGSSPELVRVPRRGEYVHPGRARTSFLAWQVLGRNTSRPWDRAEDRQPGRRIIQMPPPEAGALTELEIRTILEWIDLGAPLNATPSDAPGMGPPHRDNHDSP